MVDALEIWTEPQRIRQQSGMDCGVGVFAELARFGREELLRDMPEAFNGITVDRWKAYLESKGHKVHQYAPNEEYPLPCAHLVATGGGCHWIYQAENGGFHDPSVVFMHTPPRTIRLDTHYGPNARILTIALTLLEYSSSGR